MAMRALQFPENVRESLARRYRDRRGSWLLGGGEWPLELTLGCPTERQARQDPESLAAWAASWRSWQGAGKALWSERNWKTLGTQRLPVRIVISDPESVAAWLGEQGRWRQARDRYRHFVARWPALASILPRHFEVLAEYSDADIGRLENVLAWLEANPASNLYLRQLPIVGLDSKWVEGRTSLIAGLIAAIRANASDDLDFFRLCGLRPTSRILRLCLLDQSLRQHVGGLRDISAPVEELAKLNLPASRVYVIENLQTGLAFPDTPGSIVLMGLGYGIEALARLPWLTPARCMYWGDLDTHGFAILSRARACVPHMISVLMDQDTLLGNRAMWVEESEQYAAVDLPSLTEAERSVYCGLRQQLWGRNVRLEQERIPWVEAWKALLV